MFLSKWKLDGRNPSVLQCFRDCEDMHRNIMKLFSDSRKDAGVLYRLLPERECLYILSKTSPDYDDNNMGMKCDGIRNLDEFEKHFEEGEIFLFDIIACPSKKVKYDDMKNSKRKALKSQDEQIEWINRKARQNGFNILEVQCQPEQTIYGTHKLEHGGKMYWNAVRFSGRLCISDSKTFIKGWQEGIGPGKAYGLGMMLVRR